ncbi:hypothetical protein C0W96_20885 [Photobacterium kishitanii]|uniref:DUF1311 domain-containing protein n=1 Tax=Photobacterium kishitanii TaxID=318456 RepID=A0AAX0YXW6_9GAMM|nr:hypothetical protein [Photobacterium kishitanii]PSU20689.1 hypothetical protein CTM84_11450 [Photobacterium kishitanii]PSV02145.1 hypothetical protein C0W96_20885 [Photobacterium kishitanii]PSV13219.1 hypothetical protein C0W59_17095 [Photobacterium kishitanii]PSV72299.1 hypothetical protein C0W29_20030 [Photobacterium kishitanii]PSX19768.1 hypothetical protein C0W70_07365 [Photobacterium kishitanii]
MLPFLKKTLLVTVSIGALFSTAANATNSTVAQSCITNQNYNEQGLINCLQQAAKNAKEQVYNLTDQGDIYDKTINTQCNNKKAAFDKGPVISSDNEKLALCYANAWSAARDSLLGEKYNTKLTTDVYKDK